jgi:drug/metabolite transporter (DMT)-like permease
MMAHHIDKRGLLFGLGMAFFYASMVTSVKLAADVPNEALVFFRNVISLFCIMPIVFVKKVSLKTKYLPKHLMRVFFALVALYLFYFGIKRVDLVEAIVLRNAIPLFVPFVLLLWKKHRISKNRILALMLGFLGVFVILRPSFSRMDIGMLAILVSAFFAAWSLVSVRYLTKIEKPRIIIFYFFLFMTFLSMIPMFFKWHSFPIELFIFVLLVGVSSVLYQLCLTKAYQYLPASKGACFIYFGVLFGAAYEWLLFGGFPDLYTWIGAILTIIGGTWVLLSKS